jgi:hypothetical protein
MSDPDHVRDEEIVTVRGQGLPDTAHPQDADTGDHGDTSDHTDTGM